MSESYSGGEASRAMRALARDLIAQLVPSADSDLLLNGLLAERDASGAVHPRDMPSDSVPDMELEPAAREVRRVRRQFALGESARMLQHAMNNPLTALLAEAQLLELEPLADEHLRTVGRIVELARRVAKAGRRLDTPGR